MKKWNQLCLVLMILFVAVFFGYKTMDTVRTDTAAPVISIRSDVPAVSVFDEESALLTGVTAADTVDGDVTDSLVVEKIRFVFMENLIRKDRQFLHLLNAHLEIRVTLIAAAVLRQIQIPCAGRNMLRQFKTFVVEYPLLFILHKFSMVPQPIISFPPVFSFAGRPKEKVRINRCGQALTFPDNPSISPAPASQYGKHSFG